MKHLKERQLHMVHLIKTLDRLVAERHGKVGLPIVHFQKPAGAPGERESVCVYLDKDTRDYLPYGIELEQQVDLARRWVRDGEGLAPQVVREGRAGFALEKPKAGAFVLSVATPAGAVAGPKVIDPR